MVKSAKVKNADGEEIGRIRFGNKLQYVREDANGVYVIGANCRGYVTGLALSEEPIRDMSGLYYQNVFGEPVPAFRRYGEHDVCGFIGDGEYVKVYKNVGKQYLTSKGWSMAKWFKKDRDICDPAVMRELMAAVINRAVKDYQINIRKIQKRRWHTPDEYMMLVNEMIAIRAWFEKGDYQKLFEDTESGEERLRMLDRRLAVRKDWLDEVYEKQSRITGKGLVKKG